MKLVLDPHEQTELHEHFLDLAKGDLLISVVFRTETEIKPGLDDAKELSFNFPHSVEGRNLEMVWEVNQ